MALRILGPTNPTAALGLHTQVRVCFEGTPVENKTDPQKGQEGLGPDQGSCVRPPALDLLFGDASLEDKVAFFLGGKERVSNSGI